MNTTDNKDWIAAMPKEVRQGVILYHASIWIGIVGAVIDPNVRITDTLSIGLILFSFVFSIFMIAKISMGRNWARITMLVIFLIGTPVSVLFCIVEFRKDPLLGSLRIIIFIMQMVSLCLIFTKSANPWFKTHKAASQVE